MSIFMLTDPTSSLKAKYSYLEHRLFNLAAKIPYRLMTARPAPFSLLPY